VFEGAKYHKFNVEHVWPLYKQISNSTNRPQTDIWHSKGNIFNKETMIPIQKINSYYINYNSSSTPLCNIALKYDTDKCAIRANATGTRHSHPYSIFYNHLFESAKDLPVKYCEIGILYGESLWTFADYFEKADIVGFEYSSEFINNFNAKNTNSRIKTEFINVRDRQSILDSLNKYDKFDIIIEDSTHEFDDQIRFIKCATDKLNAGGIMIIEDIFKKENEEKYYNELKDLLHAYEDVYFVTLDHVNRNSHGWDNDKLLILKKKGVSMFNYKPKITLITPSCRPSNLSHIKNTIEFD
jgi:predicted O-methyltransferase YrrM